MTVEQKNSLVLIDEEFDNKARTHLSKEEYAMLVEYVGKDGDQIAMSVATRMFQLFINGSSTKEIHRLNQQFDYGSIVWARIKFDWDRERDKYMYELQEGIRSKLAKAHLETADLLSSMLLATNKKHGDKIRRYLQSGEESDMKNVLNIENIHNLLKVVDGLKELVAPKGKDASPIVNLTLNQNGAGSNQDESGLPAVEAPLSTDDAAAILKIVADSKRKMKDVK